MSIFRSVRRQTPQQAPTTSPFGWTLTDHNNLIAFLPTCIKLTGDGTRYFIDVPHLAILCNHSVIETGIHLSSTIMESISNKPTSLHQPFSPQTVEWRSFETYAILKRMTQQPQQRGNKGARLIDIRFYASMLPARTSIEVALHLSNLVLRETSRHS